MVVAAVGDLPCFKDLIAVLFECLLIISLGYLSGRFNLISTQAKDLNSYLTTFALPMIIFLNIAQMEFQTINLSFLFCMLTAKLLVFILVTILTLTISYPRNFGYAGALSILATQSNDFALGYPLIKSLYGETKPEMLNYLSLMAPIQLLILNPLGIAMLEYNKSKLSKTSSNQQLVIETPRRCNHLTSSSSSPDANCHKKSEQIDTSSNNSQPKQQQLRIRIQANPLTRKTPQGSFSGEATDRSPIRCGGLVTDSWQQSVHQPPSSHDQTSVTMDDDGHHHNHSLVGVIKGDRMAKLMGFKHKNIKTLTLVMPPASNATICGSDDSIITLNENRLVDCEFGQQTRVNHNSTTIDCELVQPSQIICNHQNALNQQQHPPVMAINVDLPDSVVCAECAGSAIVQSPLTNVTTKLCSAVNLNFLKALATNPLIIASVIALLVNLIHGPALPKFVTRVSNTIAASFASPALFVVGLSMYGKFELFRRNPSELLLSSVLVLTKVLILPSLMRTLALMILPKYTPTEELNYLIDFSFLYGLLPTAPTACIIANQYGVLANVVSISMLLSTFLSTPLMMASAFIINPASVIKVEVIEAILSQTMQVSSIVTLTLALLTLYAFWKSRKSRDNSVHFTNITQIARESINEIRSKPTHVFLLLLAISQVIIGIGGLIWYFVDTSKLNSMPNTFNNMHYPLAALDENRINFDDNVTSLLPSELPQTATMLPAPVQGPLGPSSETLLGLESISGPDMLAPLEPPSVAEHLPEPAAFSEPFDSRVTTPRLYQIDLGLRTLSIAQYVFSSYGLMMARFVLLCLLLVIAAIKFKGEVVVKRVAEIMLKTYLTLAATLLIWLVFYTDQPQHLPVEASLPSHTNSMWIRLLHDIAILLVSIPLFALIIRSYNKDKLKQSDNLVVSDDEVGPDLIKRRFLTSTASLSSDASSAMTNNTNLESSPNASQCVQLPQDVNNNIPSSTLNDPMSIVLENGHFEIIKRSISPIVDGPIMAPLNNVSSSINNSSSLLTEDQRIGTLTENNQNRNYELDDPTTNESSRPPATRSRYHLSLPEFNKYSILIVFILINTAHNMTSIAQKLLHHESFGTFRQIEVTNAALEFGQGLLTFLIFGMRGFFD